MGLLTSRTLEPSGIPRVWVYKSRTFDPTPKPHTPRPKPWPQPRPSPSHSLEDSKNCSCHQKTLHRHFQALFVTQRESLKMNLRTCHTVNECWMKQSTTIHHQEEEKKKKKNQRKRKCVKNVIEKRTFGWFYILNLSQKNPNVSLGVGHEKKRNKRI